jgi:hypothetical protein
MKANQRGLKEVLIVEDDLEWITENPQQAIDSLKNETFGVAVLEGMVFDNSLVARRLNTTFIKTLLEEKL